MAKNGDGIVLDCTNSDFFDTYVEKAVLVSLQSPVMHVIHLLPLLMERFEPNKYILGKAYVPLPIMVMPRESLPALPLTASLALRCETQRVIYEVEKALSLMQRARQQLSLRGVAGVSGGGGLSEGTSASSCTSHAKLRSFAAPCSSIAPLSS